MKNHQKLFVTALSLCALHLAGCNHYDPAADLAANQSRIRHMVQNASLKMDTASKETLDKITQLSPQDPAKASALVGNLSDNGLAKDAGVMNVAQNWFAKDPHAAVAWLDTLPPGYPRDHGIETILLAAVNQDPPTALALANSISSPLGRMNRLDGVVALWAKADPAAAASAVQSAKLTDVVVTLQTADQEREELLHLIQANSPPAK